MSQLDDFKRVLGLDDNYQEEIKPSNTPANESPASKKKTDSGQKRTIAVPGELHTRISLLGLWIDREGVIDNPKLYDVISFTLDEYLKTHPEAAGYVNKA